MTLAKNKNIGPASLPAGKQRLYLSDIMQTGGALTIQDLAVTGWFPAGQPIHPISPAGTPPRRYAYMPLTNISFQGRDGQVDFNTIRNFSYYPIIRFILETVKDKVAGINWQFRPRQKKGETKVAFRKRVVGDDRVDQLNAFFAKPDGWQWFRTWLRGLVDDMLVIDAASVWLQKDQEGRICSLGQIDGAQVFPLLDESGNQPASHQASGRPASHLVQTSPKKATRSYLAKKRSFDAKGGSPAFQLTPYGFPAQEMTDTELIYAVRNRLTYRKYGFSPIEQALAILALGLGRLDFQAAFYRSGMGFEFIAFMPPDVPIAKVEEANGYLESILSGNARNRRKGFFLPSYGGDKQPNIIFPKLNEQVLKDEFDEWLARVCCYCLGVSPTAFIKQVNRAVAEEMSVQGEIEGLQPYIDWCRDLLNEILGQLGYGDMEAVPEARESRDPLKSAQVDASDFGHGLCSWNDIAERNNRDQVDELWANQHIYLTPNGPVPLESLDDAESGDFRPAPAISADKPPVPPPVSGPSPKGQGGVAKRGRPRLQPGSLTRNSQIAAAQLELALRTAFQKAKGQALGNCAVLFEVKKADDGGILGRADYWNRIARQLQDAVPEASAALEQAALSGVGQASLLLDMDEDSLVGPANDQAAAWARDRAAELVGMKRLPDGTLVNNPDAKWNILETTRERLNSIVEESLKTATSPEELQSSVKAALEEGEAGIFSDARAALIAKTEVGRAQMGASLGFWERSGVVKRIAWEAIGPDPCDECLMNDGEEVNLGDAFPSGAKSTLESHPDCNCAVYVASTKDEEA
jgi:hypothetical protein